MKNILFLTLSLCFSVEMFASDCKADSVLDTIEFQSDPIAGYTELQQHFKPVLDALLFDRTYHLTPGFAKLSEDINELIDDVHATRWQIAFVTSIQKQISEREKKYKKNQAKRAHIKKRNALQSSRGDLFFGSAQN